MKFRIEIKGTFSNENRKNLDRYVGEKLPKKPISWEDKGVYLSCDYRGSMETTNCDQEQAYLTETLREGCKISFPADCYAQVEGIYRPNGAMRLYGDKHMVCPEFRDGMRSTIMKGALSVARLPGEPLELSEGESIDCFTSSLAQWRQWIPQFLLYHDEMYSNDVIVYMPAHEPPFVEVGPNVDLCSDPRGMDRWWDEFYLQLDGKFTGPAYSVVSDLIKGPLPEKSPGRVKCEVDLIDTVHEWGCELSELGCVVRVVFRTEGIWASITAPEKDA